jgi:DNA-binding IclR family transcriptional regulator
MSNTLKLPLSESSQNQYVITSAYRTLEILRAFGAPPHRFSLAELTAALEMDKGQTYRSLKTLEEAGFLRASEDGRFSLTPLLNVLSVAASSGQSASLAEVAAPHLNRLSDETAESVHLFARVDDHAVCVGIRESKHPVRLSAALGNSAPLHAGASPKAMLAHLPEAEQARVLAEVHIYPKYTGQTLVDPGALRDELERIRRRGYAVSDEDVDAGAKGVGAPIFDLTGKVVGAISVGGPSYRVNDAKLRTFSTLIVQGAQAISRQLGYSG